MKHLSFIAFIFTFVICVPAFGGPPGTLSDGDEFEEFDGLEQSLTPLEEVLVNSDMTYEELAEKHPGLIEKSGIKASVNTSVRDNLLLNGMPTFIDGMVYGPYGVAVNNLENSDDETLRNVLIGVGIAAVVVGGVLIVANSDCCAGGECSGFDQACNALFSDACSGIGDSCSASGDACSSGCSSSGGGCSSSGSGGCN